MATDVTTLGIRIDLNEIKSAIKALEQLSKSAEKTEDSTDKVTNSFSRASRAIKNLEQANLAQEKTATQAAKTAAVLAATQESAANQQASRLRAQARLEEGIANQKAVTAKRIELLAAKEAQASALSQKYTEQASAAQQRAANFALNQQSLIQNRALTTQARIEQGASRLALQQEKFEFQKAQAAERAARRSQSAWDNIKSGAQQFVGGAAAALGFAGAAGSALSIIQTADSMTLLDSRLKLATKSQEEFVRTQQALRESSLQTGLGLEDQIKGYTQLERSTRAMGLSSQQLTFLTESFGKAAVVSGADTASYQSALTQLNQGFASGVIRGQEFNSVAEQAPAIMEALASGLRGSNKEFDDLEKKGYLGVAALRKMAGEGKLVNSVTIPALIEGLKVTNEQFDKMPLTVQRATEKLKTAYQIWVSDQNNAIAGTNTLANAIGSLAANFGTAVKYISDAAVVIGTLVAGKIASSIYEATKASSAWTVVSGQAAKATAAQALENKALAEANLLAAKSEYAKASATDATGLVVGNVAKAHSNLAVATKEAEVANIAYAKATSNTAYASSLATGAVNGLKSAFAAVGGWPALMTVGVMGIIAYWDDIRAAMGSAEAQAKLTGQAIENAVNKNKFAEANAELAKLDSVYAKQEARLLKANKIIRDMRESGKPIPQTLLDNQQKFAQELFATGQERNKYTNLINTGKERQASEALRLIDKYGQAPTTITGPQPESKVKTPKSFDPGELALTNAKGVVQALEEELKLTQELGTAKDNLNSHEIKAYQLQLQIAALNPASKNYEQLKSNLELQLAEEKRAGVLQKEIDTLQKRNKAINDWRDEVDKIINKQQELNTYSAVDLASKAGETSQEAAARRTKENYQDALSVLKDIANIRTKGQAAGASPSEIEQSVGRALGSQQGRPAEASFANQLQIVDNEMWVAQMEGNTDKYKQLEELRTAILEEQTRQRNALRAQESQAIQQQISTMQAGTESILSILETSGAKQTGIYKALFAVNKAFAIANSIIKIQQGIAEASSLPFPANLGAMATVAASTASIVSTIAGTDAQFAKGGAFVGGDVVSTPTTFPMSGGRTGLMGEKGAEAVMPLSRDANGRLGVTVNGGNSSGGGVVQNITNNITVQGGNNDQETANVISRELLRTMQTIAKNEIVQARRPGGALA